MNVLDLLETGLASRDTAHAQLPVDLAWNQHGYRVEADVPGVRDEDLTIDVNARGLTIRAERSVSSDEDAVWSVKERTKATVLERELSFSEDIDPAAVRAALKAGVLTIQLPLAANAVKRRVPINADEPDVAARLAALDLEAASETEPTRSARVAASQDASLAS